jgi:ElaB/YqjD/DUF883 family membrane-anchored ribosome-binding protein
VPTAAPLSPVIQDCLFDFAQAVLAEDSTRSHTCVAQAGGALAARKKTYRALKKYRAFMDQTTGVREQLDEAVRQVDAYIDEQIEHARLDKAFGINLTGN